MNTVLAFKPKYNQSVEERVKKYKELTMEIKALEEKRDALKADLLKCLQDDNKIYNSKGLKIAYAYDTNREYFKTKKFKEAYPEGFEEYFYSVKSTTFKTV